MSTARLSERERVAKFGLKVLCLNCGRRYRHRPEGPPRLRLRDAQSPCCNAPMRTVRWVEATKRQARKELLAWRSLRETWA